MSVLEVVQISLDISDKLVSISVGVLTLWDAWKAVRDKKNHRE
ncbi:hypothetical protein ACE41H_21425 [Paenibacillus enshidis]|uniref:Holin n=1 Tax=Paenibacillus enshidis TaxID=1458439 RepID=A0ABV5AYN4_9BACL